MTAPADYLRRGWKIFPCHSIQRGQCTCSQGIACQSPGKHPLTRNGFQDASSDPETIRAWESRWPWANWAVATGHINNIIVIDIDPRNGGFDSIEDLEIHRLEGPLPNTLRSATGGGGRHLFYLYPPNAMIKKDNRGKWLRGVDVQSDGGYVILPEGTHVSGGRYIWINPDDQMEWLPPDIVADLSRITTVAGAGESDLGKTSDLLKGVPEGQRDDTLFRLACRFRRQLGDDARGAVEVLILEAARGCLPPFPDDLALRKVEQAWQQDHTDAFVDLDWIAAASTGSTGPHELTDLGNARRFRDEYGRNVLYVHGWGWLVWTDIGWQHDSQGQVPALTHRLSDLIIEEARVLESKGVDLKIVSAHKTWAKRSQSAATMNNTLEVAQNMTELRQPVEAFDADDHLLVCRNGVVDLRTGLLRSIDRNDLVTKNTGVIYDPAYRLQEWEDFIHAACDGDQETIDYLRRSMGCTLTGDTTSEAFWMISGPPAAGKSTFLDGFHAALGSYATTTQSETFMWNRGQGAPPNELARLAGLRMVSISEIREGQGFNDNLIKQIAGGDQVTARFLYKDTFQFRPQFALWIGTNHDPRALDDAIWRRIKVIKFPNAIPPERRNYRLKPIMRDPDVGGRAVLAWAIRGAMEWYAYGLQQPMSVTAAVWEYHQEQDQDQQFITECLKQTDGLSTPLSTVYNAYRMWCMEAGISNPKNRIMFAKMMKDKGFKKIMNDQGHDQYINLVVAIAPSSNHMSY